MHAAQRDNAFKELLLTFWIRLATFCGYQWEQSPYRSPSHPSTADEASLRCYVVMYCAGDILANTHMQLYIDHFVQYTQLYSYRYNYIAGYWPKCLLHSTRRYTYCIIYMYHADLCTLQEMRNAISRSCKHKVALVSYISQWECLLWSSLGIDCWLYALFYSFWSLKVIV